MTTGEALFLGILQGLTEFLPISSTAHLRVIPAFLGWDDPGAAFTAVVQLGTLVAVFAYFRADVARLTVGFARSLRGPRHWNPDGRQAWMIAVGTIPIVLCGLAFKDAIEVELRSLVVIAAALIGLALLLLCAEWGNQRRHRRGQPPRSLDDLNWADVLWIGLAQALALIPGASRSGVTLTGGLFRGFDRATAARFSFLLSLPSVLAAGVFQLVQARATLFASSQNALNILVASFAAAVVGYLAIAFLLNYLKRHTTGLFIVYRLLLGGLILWWLGLGRLPLQ